MMKVEIGTTAGEIWKFLGKNGKTAMSVIGKKMGLTPEMTVLSVGWLAREDKINVGKEGKGTAVSLTETEAKIYQQAQE